jgi:hypothetical protein
MLVVRVISAVSLQIHMMPYYALITTGLRTTRNTCMKGEITIHNGIIFAGNVPKLPANYPRKKSNLSRQCDSRELSFITDE